MSYEREHRLDDRALRALLHELSRAEPDVDVPGKGTLVEQLDRLALMLRHTGPSPRAHGRQAALRPGQRALVDDALTAVPKLEFRDCQALALRDVLSRLRQNRALARETIAAADPRVARRVAGREHGDSGSGTASAPTQQGQAMWGAANARAVTLYRRSLATGTVALGNSAVTAALNAIGSGAPLDPDVCRKMERILGVRLDRVRLHTGRVAEEAAKAACADAFTVGEDIFLPGYNPASPACQKLLLHELVHCCQWWQGRIGPSAHRVSVSQPGDALEQEAEAVVARAFHEPAQHAQVTAQHMRGPSAPRLRRNPTAHPATMLLGPVSPLPGNVATNSAMVMRQASFQNRGSDDRPLEVSSWGIKQRLNDLKQSAMQAGSHISAVGGEHAALLQENWGWIATGIVGSFALYQAADAGSMALIGTGHPYAVIAGSIIQIVLNAAPLLALTGAVAGAFDVFKAHIANWARIGWDALGRPERIALASKELVRAVASLLTVAIARLGAAAAGAVGPLAARVLGWIRAQFGGKHMYHPSASTESIAGVPARSGHHPSPSDQRLLSDHSNYPRGIAGVGGLASSAPVTGDQSHHHIATGSEPSNLRVYDPLFHRFVDVTINANEPGTVNLYTSDPTDKEYERRNIGYIQFEQTLMNEVDTIKVTHIYVDPDFRGNRLSTVLFERMVEGNRLPKICGRLSEVNLKIFYRALTDHFRDRLKVPEGDVVKDAKEYLARGISEPDLQSAALKALEQTPAYKSKVKLGYSMIHEESGLMRGEHGIDRLPTLVFRLNDSKVPSSHPPSISDKAHQHGSSRSRGESPQFVVKNNTGQDVGVRIDTSQTESVILRRTDRTDVSDSQEMIGYVSYKVAGDTIEIINVKVDPEFQNQKLSRRLFEEMFRSHPTAVKISTVFTDGTNKTAFYRSLFRHLSDAGRIIDSEYDERPPPSVPAHELQAAAHRALRETPAFKVRERLGFGTVVPEESGFPGALSQVPHLVVRRSDVAIESNQVLSDAEQDQLLRDMPFAGGSQTLDEDASEHAVEAPAAEGTRAADTHAVVGRIMRMTKIDERERWMNQTALEHKLLQDFLRRPFIPWDEIKKRFNEDASRVVRRLNNQLANAKSSPTAKIGVQVGTISARTDGSQTAIGSGWKSSDRTSAFAVASRRRYGTAQGGFYELKLGDSANGTSHNGDR